MQIKSFILTSLGFSFLGLGAVGLLLPIWPTTPFVLASFACFSASFKHRARILRISFFRAYIENYEHGKGLSKRTFWISLIWLWGMLVLSMIITRTLWLTLLLTFIGLAVTIHIIWVSKARKKSSL